MLLLSPKIWWFFIGIHYKNKIYRHKRSVIILLAKIQTGSNNAQNITDLKVPPANHLEKLSGSLLGFYSIRINKQWRIIFSWNSDHAFEVQIIDYH